MVITYKTIKNITFPIYRLRSDNWSYTDGLLFLDNEIIDDRNMPGNTLGLRRVQTSDPRLGKLNKQIISVQGLLKQATPYFIDSKGIPFIYQKTQMCTLKYKHINKVHKAEGSSFIICKKIPPFRVPRPPETGQRYAGILYLKEWPYMLYEYSEGPKKDTRRKV